jgi:hypothetical protein
MRTVDGFGREWELTDRGDGLSIYPEDQSFENVKQEWNILVRCGKYITSVGARVHGDAVDDAPHAIEYHTSCGIHRTAECDTDHFWQEMSETPTVRFAPPAHVTNACAPTEVKWIPCVKWGTRSRMPLGWTRPTPVCKICGGQKTSTKKTTSLEPVCDTENTSTKKTTSLEPVCDTQTTDTTHVDTVCDTQTTDTTHVDTICDTQTTDTTEKAPVSVADTLTVCADDCLTGSDGKPLSYDTTADEYYETGGKGRDDQTVPDNIATSSIPDPKGVVMTATAEEIQRVEEYLASRRVKKVVSKEPPMNKLWIPPTRVVPPKPAPPRVLTQKSVFRNAPGLQWSRPTAAKVHRVIKTKSIPSSKELKFRF